MPLAISVASHSPNSANRRGLVLYFSTKLASAGDGAFCHFNLRHQPFISTPLSQIYGHRLFCTCFKAVNEVLLFSGTVSFFGTRFAAL
ncbi:hypothetical protein HPP92_004468 [Vanilla planifolia]|uniref:Uncharacterized protein n=1 Tax=Vanilla planifolia TaxID=51239 RepID=A0A835VI54_VANPL|nr:hypothetical protein HPP92_004468 [Vanilla planifolia]